MDEPRIISDDMPDKIKYAINYLNQNNVSLTEAELLDDEDDEEDDDDISFDGIISDSDDSSDDMIDDDINEQDTDVSDLDSLF